MNRLTEADYLVGLLTEDEQFDYDKLGNRESVTLRDESVETYAVNYLTNRYDNDAGEDIVCEYDDAGNTTVDPNGYQYTYDYENRIIEIKDKDSVSIVEYVYDALGRRIQVYDMVADTKTQYYYNDNWQVLLETDYDDSTPAETELISYIYGNYIDEVLFMTDHNDSDKEYYYTHDHLYSPVALLEDDGTIVERYEYDAYGQPYFMDANFNLLTTQESAYGNPYGFTGRRVDVLDSDDYRVQYSRNRYYDYYTGRWLTHDPKEYINGLNLYQYVFNNPIIFMDPLGFDAIEDYQFLNKYASFLKRNLLEDKGANFHRICKANGVCLSPCWLARWRLVAYAVHAELFEIERELSNDGISLYEIINKVQTVVGTADKYYGRMQEVYSNLYTFYDHYTRYNFNIDGIKAEEILDIIEEHQYKLNNNRYKKMLGKVNNIVGPIYSASKIVQQFKNRGVHRNPQAALDYAADIMGAAASLVPIRGISDMLDYYSEAINKISKVMKGFTRKQGEKTMNNLIECNQEAIGGMYNWYGHLWARTVLSKHFPNHPAIEEEKNKCKNEKDIIWQ